MNSITITAGPSTSRARFEDALAPKACVTFRELPPDRKSIIHVR